MLRAQHRTVDDGTIMVSVDLCDDCASHGATRRIDTIETGEQSLDINGKCYTLHEAEQLRLRLGLAIQMAKLSAHGRELMAHDSGRDERALDA
jgi:hypothetical protein